jgi:hypothetical protein
MPSTLYAVTGGVLKSTDAGVSWGEANTGLANTAVRVLAIDPITPGVLYAGTGGGVFKSTDAGVSWGEANTGLANTDVRALAIDPITPGILYAGTAGGVFKSTDAGASWGAANTGLTNLDATALAIDSIAPGMLYVGTDGGGVFAIRQIAGCTGDCRNDGTVSVDELVSGITIALEGRPVDACPSFDVGGDERVTIEELLAGVHNTLNGCPTEGPPARLSGTLFVTAAVGNTVYAIDAATKSRDR